MGRMQPSLVGSSFNPDPLPFRLLPKLFFVKARSPDTGGSRAVTSHGAGMHPNPSGREVPSAVKGGRCEDDC